MRIEKITAEVKAGDPGPGDVYAPFAEVVVALSGDVEVTFVIHQSKVHSNTINVEIDGDLTASDPSLRVHLNDYLVFDSTQNAPELPDLRTDLDEGDDDGFEDERTYRIVRKHFQNHDDVVLHTGLSLEEAQAHCNNPETSSTSATGIEPTAYTAQHGPWFDAYYEET